MAAREHRDGRRNQRRPRGREGGEAHAPAAQPRDRLELGLGGRDAGENRLGVLDQRAPGVGQAHATRAAVEQRRPRLALERGDLLRDAGLGVGEGLGGVLERAVLGDGSEDAKALDIEHKGSLSHSYRFLI
jgi:hypothetical protein